MRLIRMIEDVDVGEEAWLEGLGKGKRGRLRTQPYRYSSRPPSRLLKPVIRKRVGATKFVMA